MEGYTNQEWDDLPEGTFVRELKSISKTHYEGLFVIMACSFYAEIPKEVINLKKV